MENILIVKTSAMGDLIHVYPVIDYLSKKFPRAKIDWVVEAPCAGLVQTHPGIHKPLIVSTKAWRRQLFDKQTYQELNTFRKQLREVNYDLVLDLQGNIKSGLIVSQARGRNKVGFAFKSVPEKPNLLFTNHRYNPHANGNIRQDYLAIVTSFFNDPIPAESGKVTLKISEQQRDVVKAVMAGVPNPQRATVIVCPGSAWQNKQMTPEALSAFLAQVQKLMGCNYLFVWGSPEEKQIAENLNAQFAGKSLVVEKMSLAMLQNLMGISDLVIAMDSLPLHLAGTTDTPSYSVFGASSAEKYKPLGPHHGAYQGTCPYGRTFVKRCPILRTCPTGACIRGLDGPTVFDNFRVWWESNTSS